MDKTSLANAALAEEYLKLCTVDLTVVGLIALIDPPKEDTEETVKVCRRAGIRFAMVTGALSLIHSFVYITALRGM